MAKDPLLAIEIRIGKGGKYEGYWVFHGVYGWIEIIGNNILAVGVGSKPHVAAFYNLLGNSYDRRHSGG